MAADLLSAKPVAFLMGRGPTSALSREWKRLFINRERLWRPWFNSGFTFQLIHVVEADITQPARWYPVPCTCKLPPS